MGKRGSNPDAAFIDAIKLHQAGRLVDAKSLYRRILDTNSEGYPSSLVRLRATVLATLVIYDPTRTSRLE